MKYICRSNTESESYSESGSEEEGVLNTYMKWKWNMNHIELIWSIKRINIFTLLQLCKRKCIKWALSFSPGYQNFKTWNPFGSWEFLANFHPCTWYTCIYSCLITDLITSVTRPNKKLYLFLVIGNLVDIKTGKIINKKCFNFSYLLLIFAWLRFSFTYVLPLKEWESCLYFIVKSCLYNVYQNFGTKLTECL